MSRKKALLDRFGDVESLMTYLEKEHRVLKILLGRRMDVSKRRIHVQRETRLLLMDKTDGNGGSGTETKRSSVLDVRLMKDVHTLDYKLNKMHINESKWRQREMQCYDPKKVLLIYHGTEFVLNITALAFDTADDCDSWVFGLRFLQTEATRAAHPLVIERWLRKEFYALCEPSRRTVSVKVLKLFIQQRLQCKISSKGLQELVNDHLGFEAFANAYRRLIHIHSLFSEKFLTYSDDSHLITCDSFIKFLLWEQKDNLGNDKALCSRFLGEYLRDLDPGRYTKEPHLTVQEFVDFLFSRENSIFDPTHKRVTQDMNRPLSDYWISSSHNTYLTGDQLKSESSLDAYARCLLMGCRCVELDCWDGTKRGPLEAEIIIYHGYTMTTKLNLRDVLQTIKEYAFRTSIYPVILSIEDNCTLQFQRQLALDLKEIFGDMLLTIPIDKEATRLPSPNQLIRKIIVKHKKIPTVLDHRSNSMSSAPFVDESLQDQDLLALPDIQKKGVLHIRDPETNNWIMHVFVLFSDRLCFTQNVDVFLERSWSSGEDLPSDSVDEDADDQSEGLKETFAEELHLSEEWFHGKISRDDAVHLLKLNSDLGSGLFLVRESTTFIGDYSLSFLYNGSVHHCRIKTSQIRGVTFYFLQEAKKMDTLYELISYYQEHTFNTPKFRTKLVTPCPQPMPHLDQPWFAGAIDKVQAEDMLNAYPLDGAFLIRYSGTADSVFTLSFRVDGQIKHCRLKQEGHMFVVGSLQFENLIWVVEYYNKHELFHGVCLKYPVNSETIEQYSKELSCAPSGSYMDLARMDLILMRATSSYAAKTDLELSFPLNAIISVTRKEDSFWYRGFYRGKIGLVPVDCVEKMQNIISPGPILSRSSSSSASGGHEKDYVSLSLGSFQIEEVESDRPYAFRIFKQTSCFDVQDPEQFIVAAATREDQLDWINSFLLFSRSVNDKISTIRSKEKCLRIASELSNLVVYCQAVPFCPEKIPGNYFEMCSFSDSKLEKFVEKGLVLFNQNQLSRVYPNASRLTSANFNPVPMWNVGCQMVALNYQTSDKSMQLNQGRFLANGGCGYVLKPEFMMQENYDSSKPQTIANPNPIILTIEIIAGRHLSRKEKGKGIASPVVDVEVIGLPCDSRTYRTSTVSCNGLHPVWDEQFEFNILAPEAALLRFNVEDGDFVGPSADPFIAQAVFPVNCLRSGYRSVPLRNASGEELELSSLLVHLDIRNQAEDQRTDPIQLPGLNDSYRRAKHRHSLSMDSPEPPSDAFDRNKSDGFLTERTPLVSSKRLSYESLKKLLRIRTAKSEDKA